MKQKINELKRLLEKNKNFTSVTIRENKNTLRVDCDVRADKNFYRSGDIMDKIFIDFYTKNWYMDHCNTQVYSIEFLIEKNIVDNAINYLKK